jgi:TonB family protein
MKKNVVRTIFIFLIVSACNHSAETESNKVLHPEELNQKSATADTLQAAASYEDPVYFVVEEMPEYQGGETALRQYLASHVTYPEAAKKDAIQGRVYVSFVVDKSGSVRDVKVVRSVHPALDQEAVRVIEELPDWTPGKQSGENVSVNYTVPISFVLE